MAGKELISVDIDMLEFRNYKSGVGDVSDLEVSIAKLGLKEPIQVEQLGAGRYAIKDGHRRVTAIKNLSEKSNFPRTVEAIVVETENNDAKRVLEQMAINDVRKLDSVAKAKQIKKLHDEKGMTFADIGEALGLHETTAAQLAGMVVTDNAPMVALMDGKTLYYHRKLKSKFFLTTKDIEAAGEDPTLYDKIEQHAGEIESVWYLRELVKTYKELNRNDPDHVKTFNYMIARLIESGERTKESIESTADRINRKIQKAQPNNGGKQVIFLDPDKTAKKLVKVLQGGRFENIETIQKALKTLIKELNLPYKISIKERTAEEDSQETVVV